MQTVEIRQSAHLDANAIDNLSRCGNNDWCPAGFRVKCKQGNERRNLFYALINANNQRRSKNFLEGAEIDDTKDFRSRAVHSTQQRHELLIDNMP